MLLRGTKGGQPRPLPVDSEEKYRLLVRVAAFQQSLGQDSLIPSHLSFKAFQSDAWRQTKQADASYLSHGERKHFACNTYYQLMGACCPVQANVAHGKRHHQHIASTLNINEAEAKQRDYDARMQISKLLGHHRVSITNAYLG
ncbi:hypothetical protein ACOV11_20245 [Vibrio natriegens]